jgi:DNA-binding SARP family transcriptional activator
LPGFYEDWIAPERERLADAYRQALGRMVAALEATGDLPGANEYARRLVVADPLREDAQGELIRLFLQTGRRAEALREYKLRSAGVLSGRSAAEARPRCGLYRIFLERHLE